MANIKENVDKLLLPIVTNGSVLKAQFEDLKKLAEKSLDRCEVEALCPFCTGTQNNHLYLNPKSNFFFCQHCKASGTANGYIQGLQIRLDDEAKKRYRWLSTDPQKNFSKGHNGLFMDAYYR